MSQKELIFASTIDAIQYLSEYADAKVLIARMTPDKDDYVIFLNPRTNHYHVLQYPGDSIREFSKDDNVKDLRPKGSSGPLTFSDSMEPVQVAKEVADMLAGLDVDQRKTMKAEDMRGIFMADSLASDRGDVNDTSKIDFVTDRGYNGIGSIGILKDKSKVKKDKERRLKQIKKAPSRYKGRGEKEAPKLQDIANQEVSFASSDEAMQYLADITGKQVSIG